MVRSVSMTMRSCAKKLLLRVIKQPLLIRRGIIIRPDTFDNNTIKNELLERNRRSRLSKDRETEEIPEMPKEPYSEHMRRMREKYPEFLPKTVYPAFLTLPPSSYRDRVRELLEREDMYKRRDKIKIPEFYPGSILAVTVADPYSAGKSSRFLGICIHKGDSGLYHKFTLRNVIDEQGVEMMYYMYSPLVQKIELILLEKRLDEELFYLRDAPLEYSFFPQDMELTLHPKDAPVPVNETKVRLNPRPWTDRWERLNLKGVEDLTSVISERKKKRMQHPFVKREWEKHDIIADYRKNINPIESAQIYAEFTARMGRRRGLKAPR